MFSSAAGGNQRTLTKWTAIDENMQIKQIPLTQTLACLFYEWGVYLWVG